MPVVTEVHRARIAGPAVVDLRLFTQRNLAFGVLTLSGAYGLFFASGAAVPGRAIGQSRAP